MWSLKNILELNGSHFPDGFSAENGVKSLFPAHYTGSIKLLSTYVFVRTGAVINSNQDYATYVVAADGQGRWFFSWTGNPNSMAGGPGPGVIADANIRLQSGFVFLYSDNNIAHGYVDSSRPGDYSLSCNSGVDPWISENWPKIFLSDIYVDFQEASGFDSLPSESGVWTGAGFAENNYKQLSGSNVACAGQGSGSALFPQEEQNHFCVLQVRDASLWSSLVNQPAAKFWQVWNQAQPSKATLQYITNHFNVRYISPDSRTVIVSGSARSFAAAPYVVQSVGFTSTVEGGASISAGGVALIATGIGLLIVAPEVTIPVYLLGSGTTFAGAAVTEFGVYDMVNASATPTSITANASPTPTPTSSPTTTTITIPSGSSANIYIVPADGVPAPYFVSLLPVTVIPPSSDNPSGTVIVGGTCVDPTAGTQSPVTILMGGTTIDMGTANQICSSPTVQPDEVDAGEIDQSDPNEPFSP